MACPFTILPSFIGREDQLDQLSAHISKAGCQRLSISGLGGCGKTALAPKSVYRLKEHPPSCAIFSISAVSRKTFEQDYGEIWMLLKRTKLLDDKVDTMRLAKAKLSDNATGQWLMIVDNTDVTNVLLEQLDRKRGTDRLIDFLPSSCKGSIIFTTRSESMAINLAGRNVLELGKLPKSEAKEVLKTRSPETSPPTSGLRDSRRVSSHTCFPRSCYRSSSSVHQYIQQHHL